MSLQEAAEFLQTSRQTLAKMAKSGEVPCQRLGTGSKRPRFRFSRTALAEWLRGRVPEFLDAYHKQRIAALERVAEPPPAPPYGGGQSEGSEASQERRDGSGRPPKHSQEAKAQALDLLKQKSVREVAAILGIPKSTVAEWKSQASAGQEDCNALG